MTKENWIITEAKDYKDKLYFTAKVFAHIKNNETGEIRIYETQEPFFYEEDLSPSVFNWEENNFSCDCNRQRFWLRVKGIELTDEEEDKQRCSDGKFSVNLQNAKTNEFYYKEYEQNEPDSTGNKTCL